MIRILGAVMVITGTAAIGLAGVRKLNKKVTALQSVITALDVMESEICTKLSPMREILEKLALDAPKPASRFFINASRAMQDLGKKSFFAIWRDAVEESKELMLSRDEQQVLTELGLCLGRYDVREQADSIARVRRRFEVFLETAEKERDRDSKLHAFFGLASGVFAVIILL